MVKKVNALNARKKLGQLLEEVYYKGDQFVIERAGRPMAAVVPIWQLEERTTRKERLFGTVEKVWQQTKHLKPGIVDHEVKQAIKAVRERAGRRKA